VELGVLFDEKAWGRNSLEIAPFTATSIPIDVIKLKTILLTV
jgi:hypothetical protein